MVCKRGSANTQHAERLKATSNEQKKIRMKNQYQNGTQGKAGPSLPQERMWEDWTLVCCCQAVSAPWEAICRTS